MKLLLIFILLFSFNSQAAYCVLEDINGNLKIDSTSIETCPSGLVLLTKSDYDAINIDSIVATLKDLFEFSVEDFAYFSSICLIAFIVGHSVGRVSRLLGKT